MLLMNLSLFILLGWFLRWEVSVLTIGVLWGVASRICSKQHAAFLWSSHLVFSLCISFVSMLCICTVVLTLPQLGKYSILSYERDQISIWVKTFARRMLTSLSVDEMLLLRYVNLSINSRDPPLKVEVTPSCLKPEFCFRASYYWLQTIQLGFGLDVCFCKKH